MKIKEILGQNRRDFWAIYECDHDDCDYVSGEKQGYDDAYFHAHVIPDMVCPACGRKALPDTRTLAPKYAPDTIV